MGPFDYVVTRIDGDYAHLKRTDIPSDEDLLVARALLFRFLFLFLLLECCLFLCVEVGFLLNLIQQVILLKRKLTLREKLVFPILTKRLLLVK